MKTRFPMWLVPLLWLLLTVRASAHLGMPFVVLEGRAGKFPVRVVVQEPDVVAGSTVGCGAGEQAASGTTTARAARRAGIRARMTLTLEPLAS